MFGLCCIYLQSDQPASVGYNKRTHSQRDVGVEEGK